MGMQISLREPNGYVFGGPKFKYPAHAQNPFLPLHSSSCVFNAAIFS